MPGYLNKSHVPPILFLPSKIKNDFLEQFCFKWQAAPIPEIPAPIIITSTNFCLLFFIKTCYYALLNLSVKIYKKKRAIFLLLFFVII